MFSPGTKKTNFSSRKDRDLGQPAPDSQVTPFSKNRSLLPHNSIPNRPATGTPAPWSSRLSVLARVSPTKKNEDGDVADSTKPVYIGEFPQVVRNEQAYLLRKRIPSDVFMSGGMDKETSLCWMICGSRLFIWSYLSPAASRKCVTLEIPSYYSQSENISTGLRGDSWLLSVVNWDRRCKDGYGNKLRQQCNSAGIILCNQNSQTLIYWPNIFSENGTAPILSLPEESDVTSPHGYKENPPHKKRAHSRQGSDLLGSGFFNSLIACAIHDAQRICVALTCSSNGELWQFHCSPDGIRRIKVYQDMPCMSSQVSNGGQSFGSKDYPRSLVWRFTNFQLDGSSNRQFFLLTDHEILCFSIKLAPELNVSKLWSQEIIGTDGDLGIKKDQDGQKQVRPLDLQVAENGNLVIVLLATSYFKDQVTSSSFIQYSLLTMQYKSGLNFSSESDEPMCEQVLERKAPIQVIIQKARVEDERFLFSMKLCVGGKPSGSVMILSGDGTAIVSHYPTSLYRFDLPYDAGKVLDASVFPSTDDGNDGAWVVLTEKAGLWAIPEKADFLGGVESPELSLSRKRSLDEDPSQEAYSVPRWTISEARDAGDRPRPALTGSLQQTAQDEESEALLGHLFHNFLSSGTVSGAVEKLRSTGAFEKEGQTNVFARASKSIVDTLAKHWTTTRGAEIVATAVVATQLMDKQQKHQKFLQFLALSKCHEELSSRQRHALQTIMEHGEKLAGMIQLRELQNRISQSHSSRISPYSNTDTEKSGCLWDLIQLVGERARRNTVLLMDRDNAEVFYSKVSDLEEVFQCLERHLEYLISTELPILVRVQRACELSNACVALVQTAMQYKNEHHMWYPSPEGLTPWYCQLVVCNGLWTIASFMLRLLNETSGLDMSAKSELYSNFEVLVEVLLESYTGAISARVEREEECKSLREEYWNRRDVLLECLYEHITDFTKAGSEGLLKAAEQQNETMHEELCSHLLSIAKRHGGYQTLWHMCCDINDLGLLRSLMHGCAGSKGGFSFFVFRELFETRQFPKLLRLGEEFHEELSAFLKWHPDLLWLHQVFLQQFPSASETLHMLALSQNDVSISAVVDGRDSESDNLQPTLSERRHLLNLSKIAAVAGNDAAEHVTTTKRIEADLKLLKLQEEIVELLPSDEEKRETGRRPLPPRDLIELCLDSQHAASALQYFDVFAWTSSSFRKHNKGLLEECWKATADLDDWGALYEASVNEGWSDEDSLRVLRGTALFQASRRCYGPEAETFEGGFDEVLPLRHENSDDQQAPDDSGSSVEAILMQHKDFADAGKLMLTAVMLGAAHVDVEEDGSLFAME